MRIKEIYEILQNRKNGKITQNDIARAIGTSRANVSKLFAKNSFINDEKLEKIEKYFEVKFNTEDVVNVKYFPDELASYKDGKIIMSEKNVRCRMPSFFKLDSSAEYIMFHANDDSMSPYILNGDFIIIEVKQDIDIINNKVYAFMYNGDIYIKRLSKNINDIVIKSDNKDYKVQYISTDNLSKFHIFGQVVYVSRKF